MKDCNSLSEYLDTRMALGLKDADYEQLAHAMGYNTYRAYLQKHTFKDIELLRSLRGRYGLVLYKALLARRG